MKLTRKLIALLICGLLLFALAACDDGTGNNNGSNTGDNTGDNTNNGGDNTADHEHVGTLICEKCLGYVYDTDFGVIDTSTIGFGIQIDNLTVKTGEGNEKGEASIDLSKVAFSLDPATGEITGAGNVTITMVGINTNLTNTCNGYAAIKDGVAYISLSGKVPDPSISQDMDYVMTFDFNELIATTDIDFDYYIDLLEQITPVIESWINDSINPIIEKIHAAITIDPEAASENAAFIAGIINSMYKAEDNAIVLDFTFLKKWNNYVYTNKISTLIDAILGEGSYASIKSLLTGDAIYNYNLGNLIDYIQDDLDIDLVALVHAIDDMLNNLYPILDGVELPDIPGISGGHVETHPDIPNIDDSTNIDQLPYAPENTAGYAAFSADTDMSPDVGEEVPGILESMIISELGMSLEELLENEELRALSVGSAIETLFGITVNDFKGQLTPIFDALENHTVYSLIYSSFDAEQPTDDGIAAIKNSIDGYIDILSGIISQSYNIENNVITSITLTVDYTDYFKDEGLIGANDKLIVKETLDKNGFTIETDVAMGDNALEGGFTIVLNPEVTIDEKKIEEIQEKIKNADKLTDDDIIKEITKRFSESEEKVTHWKVGDILYITVMDTDTRVGMYVFRIDTTKYIGCFTSFEKDGNDTIYFVEIPKIFVPVNDMINAGASIKDYIENFEEKDYGSGIMTVNI